MEIHELNTKALTSPAYVAADDGDDTYKFDFYAIKTLIDGQITALGARATDIETDVDALEDRPKIWYGSTSTNASTADKIVTCTDFALKNGDYIVVLFSQGNSVSSATLNVNGTGNYQVINGVDYGYLPVDPAVRVLFRIRFQSNYNSWFFDAVGKFYGEATTTAKGYMSAADKTALDNVVEEVAEIADNPKIWYGSCTTIASTADKIVSCADFALKVGDYVAVNFSQANTATSVTLNVNGTGAKSVNYLSGSNVDNLPLLKAGIKALFRVRYQSNMSRWYYDLIGQYYSEATTSLAGLMSAADKTALDQAVEDIAEIETEIAVLDNPEGMTVGNAEQLLSDVYTEDKVPYKYRASFSGDREFDEIVGGTVAWNQLRLDSISSYTADGITTSYDSSTHKFCIENLSRTSNYGSGSTQLTASNNAAINGHVYLFDTDAENGVYIVPTTGSTIMISSVARIYKMTSAATAFRLRVTNQYDFVTRHPVGNKYYFYGNIIDLTALFGSTIADYILAQEQATTGAGVAIFRKLFPESYYAYNAGELISVSGLSAHEMVGFNQWDEEWENGTLNASGNKVASTTTIVTKNKVPILPNTTYYMNTANGGVGRMCFYDSSQAHITGDIATSNATFTTPANASYLMFTLNGTYGATYKNDICLNLSSDRNGEYEPYQKHSYPLDSSLTLRGIPKLADGKMYFDGDTYQSDGTVTRHCKAVDLGSLSWGMYPGLNGQPAFYTTDLSDAIAPTSNIDAGLSGVYIMQAKYNLVSADSLYVNATTSGILCFNKNKQMQVRDSAYSTAAAFKAAMSGVMVVYMLETPTTETAEPFTNPQIVSEYGTEEYVSTTICPVGHNTKYPENLRKKIEGLPWDLSMIAPIENGTTASKAYSVGQYFLHNNVFCKAKTAIASGATFTLNTNYEETTVAAELYSALH